MIRNSLQNAELLSSVPSVKYDDVIKWKHFPRYWPFVRGIHHSRWILHTKTSDAELWCFFDMRLNKRLSKQPWGWWFETPPSWSLWRQCNENRKKRYEDLTELWGILLQNLYISFVRIRVYFSNTRQFKFGCIYLTNRSKDYGFMETESSSGQQQRQRLPPLFHPSFFRPR